MRGGGGWSEHPNIGIKLPSLVKIPSRISSELHKEILDNCISAGTWDRAADESPQFWGAVKRAAKNIEKKFSQLGIQLSYFDLD